MCVPSSVAAVVYWLFEITEKRPANLRSLLRRKSPYSYRRVSLVGLVAIHVFALAAPAVAQQDPYFLVAPNYSSAGTNTHWVTVADVNGDGKPDLLVAQTCNASGCALSGNVGVLLGNGDGTFQTAVNYASGGYEAFSLAVVDVNGDGKPDIIVANLCINSSNCATGTIGVLLGNGDGTFQSAVTYSSGGEYAISLAVGDVNGDGKPDIAVVNEYASGTVITYGTVAVLLGSGNGTFQAAVPYNSGGFAAESVALADVNGDGKPDLLVSNCGSSGNSCGTGVVGVLLGNGNGTFQSVVTYSTLGYEALSVAAADVNGDGKLDLVVANYCVSSTNCANGSVAVLLGNGDGTFQPALAYGSGGEYARFVAAGDVNGDGKVDVVVTNVYGSNSGSNGEISVLLGNGDGTLQSPKPYYSGGYEAYAVALADVNGDGKLDLLTANQCISLANCASGSVAALLGNGDGTFISAGSFDPGGYDSESVTPADVNGDGKLDLIIATECASSANCTNGEVAVLLGNGDGTFQNPVTYSSGGYYAFSAATADVNGDGKPDLVVLNGCVNSSCTTGTLSVFLGNGDGTFQNPVTFSSGGYSPYSVAIADVNGDGKPDLIAGNLCVSNSSCSSGGAISVLLGNGGGTFQPAATFNSGAVNPFAVVVADMNGDGKPDLVVANECATNTCTNGAISVLLGNGDGTFQPAATYNSGAAYALTVAVADMNGDGKLDLIVANECATSACTGGGAIGLLLGNGDGTFQSATTAATPELIGNPQSLAIADFNGDGKLDVASGAGNVLLLGNGDGTFETPINLGVSDPSLAVGDFNGDGKPDLAIGNIVILLNITQNFHYAATTQLASSANPATGPVTFTATVTPAVNVGQVTGTVTFYNGTSSLGNVAVSNGQAVLANVSLTPGVYSITAAYSGDTTYQASTSPVLNETVNSANTTTALVSSTNPSAYNQSVSLTATVTASAGGTPTGNVQFLDGTTVLATTPLINGTAVFTTTALLAGTHSITASYAGAGDDNASVSSPLIQVVKPSVTAMAITSSVNPSVLSQSIVFTATITPQFGGTPTGSVTFLNGTTVLASVPATANGIEIYTTAILPVGTNAITASYSGDANFSASMSHILNQVVQKANTSSTLMSSSNPSMEGQSVILTANVSSGTPGTPTGTVSFLDGTVLIGSSPLGSSGTATLSISTLAVGTHGITASYVGDPNFNGSTSVVLNQVVQQGNSGVVLTSAPNPSGFEQSVVLTATVTSTATGTPTGIVTFSDGGTTLGTSSLNASGIATLSVASLPVGTHSITAAYSGNSNFTAATSSPIGQSVQKAGTTTVLSASSSPSALTLTATITSSTSGIPTGTATFLDGTTQLGSAPLNGSGVATWSSDALSAGTHNITAVFSGDANYNASTSGTDNLTASFKLSVAGLSPSSIAPGESATTNITITPSDGFNPSEVTLTCAISPGVKPAPTCLVGTISKSNGAGTAKLTVTAAKSTALASRSDYRSGALLALGLLIPAMLLGTSTVSKHERQRLLGYLLVILLVGGCLFQSACGAGGSNPPPNGGGGTPAGSYIVTVTGTANGTQSSAPTLSLTVR